NSDNSILNKIRILGKSSLKDIISLLISKILGKNKKSEGYSSSPKPITSPLKLSIMKDNFTKGEVVFSKNISVDNVNQEGWLDIDLSDSNVLIYSTNKIYYIVLSCDGGNERNYYKWYHSKEDVYKDHPAYFDEWDGLGWREASYDFAFKISVQKLGDGVTKRFAIVHGQDGDYDGPYFYKDIKAMADVLNRSGLGWEVSFFFLKKGLPPEEEILKIAEEEDFDDVVLYYWSGHGSGFGHILDLYNFEASTQIIISDGCNSGEIIT
ncbi:MAG: universal stress protein, partial [Thermoplasmatales archaeon]|nr:universal stress protein [Thermoplasmatales archaeon]